LVFLAYINEMHDSRSKIPSKKSRPYIYIYDVKFLALLGAPYTYNISRLRVKMATYKTAIIRPHTKFKQTTEYCTGGHHFNVFYQ
jgi:hypothetical protein